MNEKKPLTDPDALLSLVQRVKENYCEPPPAPIKRGKKRDFSALSFLLLATVAVVMRTFRDSELRKLLEKDPRLRHALGFSRVPHRTSIGRRLAGLVTEAEQQIALLGQQIVATVKPAADQSAVSVVDGRMYQALGPRWHKGDREKELVPVGLRNVDTASKWSKSGYRGWVQGYRLLLQGLAFPEPVPIFAAWRPNNEHEAEIASAALEAGALKVTSVLLGDETFGKGDFPHLYAQAGGWVLAPQQLPAERRSWKDDLYDYRKETIELLFQRIMQAADLKQCCVKGEGRNGAFVLASVWLYQICFLADYREGKPLAHIKEHLDCARWRISSG
ncbi:MAG: hypothetical protein LC775_05380 [Acidobacteria bacterium]|nr:hypothetical protein [Acidobacteriota bacterium]